MKPTQEEIFKDRVRIAKLEEALKNAVDCIEIGADDSEEAGYPSRAESMREDASAYRAILQTLKP